LNMQGWINELGEMLDDGGRHIAKRDEITQPLIGFEQDEKAEFRHRAFCRTMGQKAFLRSWRVDLNQIFRRQDSFESAGFQPNAEEGACRLQEQLVVD
jgi:hypothetical protein